MFRHDPFNVRKEKRVNSTHNIFKKYCCIVTCVFVHSSIVKPSSSYRRLRIDFFTVHRSVVGKERNYI